MVNARLITHFLHSRSGGNIIVALAVAALVVSWLAGVSQLPGTNVLTDWIGLACGIASSLAIALIMQVTVKHYNMLRTVTALPAALFMTLTVAMPPLAVTAGQSNLLAITMTGAAFLLFSTFGEAQPRRRVFLMFTVVTALGMTGVVYLYFLPILLLGCLQMRILNFKSFLAALLGIITPPWIAFGSGLLSPADIAMPQFSMLDMQLNELPILTLLGVAALCIIAGVGFVSANLINVYSLNYQMRAYNGFYTLLFLTAALLSIIDFNNLSTYLPLLMAMVSYQASLFFTIRSSKPRSWIAIAVMMAVCWASYIWFTWYI